MVYTHLYFLFSFFSLSQSLSSAALTALPKVPPYVFPMLVLSKRLHSIFVLRCFNDCFAVLAFFLAMYAYQRRMWTAGSILYSLAVGVKMSALLALPAVGLILLQAIGRDRAITQAGIIVYLQVGNNLPQNQSLWQNINSINSHTHTQLLVGFPFIQANARAYFSRAFELTRVFLYKWTVNWRFVPESTFLSPSFAITLLALHVLALAAFATTRWLRPAQTQQRDGASAFTTAARLVFLAEQQQPDQLLHAARRINPRFVLTTTLASVAVGMLCARSLHYQFYAWIAWATPFLAWRAGLHPVLQYALWAAQEWAWNVYPSSPVSSGVVVGALVVQVVGVWWGSARDFEAREQQQHHHHHHAHAE